MTKKRNRTRPVGTFEDRLAADSRLAREQASKLPPGQERDILMRRIEQNNAAAEMSVWLRIPLQS